MLYRNYGSTGKSVSVLGFGGMRFDDDLIQAGNLEACADVVLRAYELGVNYFDTAPNYCMDQSEEIMGLAFRQMDRKKFYVGSKNGYNTGDKTPDDFRRRLERSLTRLGVDQLDFYYMWCIRSYDAFLKHTSPGGFYDTILKAKQEGLIGHLVISTHCSGWEVRKILEQGLFDGVLLGYNATNFKYRQEGLAAAYEHKLGVATMNPLGGGIIPQNEHYYSFLKDRPDQTIAQAALRFNARHKEITTVLSGMTTIAQVEENAAAMEDLQEFAPGERERMADLLDEKLDTLCTGCSYCDYCPKGIPVPRFMDTYNLKLLNAAPAEIQTRMKVHWGGLTAETAARCTACGLCESKCTQHLPIIERLKSFAEAGKAL